MQRQLDKNLGLVVWCGGIVIVAAALILLANLMFGGLGGDVTADKRYSLDAKTISFLTTNKEPITVRLYIAKNLAEQNPRLGQYADYVRRLLSEYQRKSKGIIDVSVVETVPFLNSQAAAEKAGIKAFDFGDERQYLYLGASFTNGKGQTLTIPKFLPEREKNIEDDITRILSSLVTDKKPVLGVVSPFFKVAGGLGGSGNRPFVEQLKGFGYQVKSLGRAISFVPEGIDAVLVFYPYRLSKETVYALEQYLLSGGNIMIVFDAFSEERFRESGQYEVYDSGLSAFLQNKGVEYVSHLLVGDRANNREFVLDGKKVNYPFWLKVSSDSGDLTLNHSGYFKYQNQENFAIKVLAETGEDSVLIKTSQVADVRVENLEKYYENSSGKYPLALLLEGIFQSTFDKTDVLTLRGGQNRSNFLSGSAKVGKLFLISDADMFDVFMWDGNAAAKHDFYETFFVSDNMYFVRDALDYLTENAYVGVKSKNTGLNKDSLAAVFRRYAENSFARERRELAKRLFDLQDRINILQAKVYTMPVSSVKQSKDLEQLRREQIDTEYKYRQVLYLTEERAQTLKSWFLFLMTGCFPVAAVLMLGGIYIWYRNMLKRKAEKDVNA